MYTDQFDFNKFLEEAKKYKMMAVESTKRGDLPPVVFVERGGSLVAVIVAPQVDKHQGLHAARLARVGFDADALCIIMDAHMASPPAFPKGMTEEEMSAEMRRRYPPGSMQKRCDEEGACATGEIVDVLLCHRIDRNGQFKMLTIPYDYHGKGGEPFRWLEDHPLMQKMRELHDVNEVVDETKYTGLIPETLREIMAEDSVLKGKLGDTLRSMSGEMDLDEKQQQYHIGRAMLRILASQNFMVVDLQEPPPGFDPEPILPPGMVSLRDLIPVNVASAIDDLANQLEQPNFLAKLTALLKPHEEAINKKAKECLDGVYCTAEQIAEVIFRGMKQNAEARTKHTHDANCGCH